MKKILLTLLLLGITFNAYGSIRNIQDNYELTYSIIDSSGNHVTGETVTLKIKKASNGYWYDFDDSTFKNSGWTTKAVNLSEDSTEGYYYYTFNPPASETSAEEYVFVVDNASATYGDHQADIVCYQNIGTSTLVASDNIGINWGDVSNPTTTVGLTGTTISTSQGIASVSGAVGSVTGGVTVTTNNDKTGYTVSTVSDKTGYSLSQAFPTNFSALSISASTGLVDITQTGADKIWATTVRTLTALDEDTTTMDLNATTIGTVTNLTTWDKTGYTVSTVSDKTGYALADSTSDAVIADAVWNGATASYGTANTYGALVETNLDTTVSSRGTSTLTASDNIGINWADVSNPTTTLNLSGTTISTSQAVASVAGGVTVTTNNDKTGYTVSTVSDKTGYSLTQAFPTNFSSLAITGAGAVTAGTVSDKTGYSLSGTQTFNLTGNITGNLSGSVGSVTTVSDKTGYSLSTAGITAIWDKDISAYVTEGLAGTYLLNSGSGSSPATIAGAVWDATLADHLNSGSTGKKLNEMPTPYDVGN